MIKYSIYSLLTVLLMTACLKTRTEVGEVEQTAVYSKKNVDNQMDAVKSAVVTETPGQLAEEKDELIRTLNGRVEVLENQLQTLQKDKEAENIQREQKITLLQEALAKIETQMHQFEGEDETKTNASKDVAKDATKGAVAKKDPLLQSSDELAQKNKHGKDKANKTEKNEIKKNVEVKKMNTYEAAQEHFNNQDWKKAILSFQKYADETPKGKNVADAKFKIGVCFQELGMKEEAMAFFEEVVANYASTEAGKKSKTRLTKLKK